MPANCYHHIHNRGTSPLIIQQVSAPKPWHAHFSGPQPGQFSPAGRKGIQGCIAEPPPDSALFHELTTVAKQLSEQNQQKLVEYAQFLLQTRAVRPFAATHENSSGECSFNRRCKCRITTSPGAVILVDSSTGFFRRPFQSQLQLSFAQIIARIWEMHHICPRHLS